MDRTMESPYKKRKLNVDSSSDPSDDHPKATSTPQIGSQKVLPFSSSGEFSNSTVDVSFRNPIVQNPGSSETDALESTSSSFADLSIQDDDEQCADYEGFLQKCRKIQRKGFTWNLYKPTRDDEGCLYHQIVFNPKGFTELARWFAIYCKSNNSTFGIFALYRFYFDCSGFQTFDLKKYLTYPPKLDKLCMRLKNEKFLQSLLKTTKFLLNDKTQLAQVLKYSIYNFIEKFVLEAHKEEILDGPVFEAFLLLIQHICISGVCKPLLYTAYIFVAKILTTLCKLKEELLNIGVNNSPLIDKYINLLYNCFVKLSYLGSSLPTLKIACISELMIWVELFPKIFVGYFNCSNVLKDLTMDQVASVRLAVLDALIKIIQNEQCLSYLKNSAMEELTHLICGRVQDVNVQVQLKALDVLAYIASELPKNVRKKSLVDQLMETMYNKDYRIGSAAAKCVIEILNSKSSDMVVLFQLSEISKAFYPKLASVLVESCISHTDVLQNWALIVNTLCTQGGSSKMTDLSNLLFESVYITLRGKPTKVRPFSNQDKLAQISENASIAAELYPKLKTLVALYATNPMIIANIFKVLVEIDYTYLSEDHYEIINDLIQHFPTFFNKWTNTETLKSVLRYLKYVMDCFPNCSNCMTAIDVLKTCVPKRFTESLNERNENTFLMTKKTALLFEVFDLNKHIEWAVLISTQNPDSCNVKFLEDLWTICHWSLIWKVKGLTAAQLPTYQHIAMELFSNCNEILKLDNPMLQHKAFERICETSVGICIEMKTLSREMPALQTEMLSFKNLPLVADLMTFFHDSMESSSPDNVKRFRKYIFLLYQMGTLDIIPMECVSSAFKYYDKYCTDYGEVIETILIQIFEKNKNWLSQLMLYSILLLFGNVQNTYELTINPESRSTNAGLNLAKRFCNVKQIACPEVIGKLLMFAINYASAKRFYDFLTCVTIFISKLLTAPEVCNEVLQTLKEKVPNKDKNMGPILTMVKALEETISRTPKSAKKVNVEQEKDGGAKANTAPGKKIQGQKGKRLFAKSTSESEMSDAMSNVDPDFAALSITD